MVEWLISCLRKTDISLLFGFSIQFSWELIGADQLGFSYVNETSPDAASIRGVFYEYSRHFFFSKIILIIKIKHRATIISVIQSTQLYFSFGNHFLAFILNPKFFPPFHRRKLSSADLIRLFLFRAFSDFISGLILWKLLVWHSGGLLIAN